MEWRPVEDQILWIGATPIARVRRDGTHWRGQQGGDTGDAPMRVWPVRAAVALALHATRVSVVRGMTPALDAKSTICPKCQRAGLADSVCIVCGRHGCRRDAEKHDQIAQERLKGLRNE